MIRRVMFLLVLACATVAAAGTLDETIDRTIDVRPGALLKLDNQNGSITLHAWDQPRVRIHAVKRADSRDESAARKALREMRIEITPTAGGVRVHTITPSRNDGFFDWLAGLHVDAGVTYDITVPRQFNLDIDDTNGRIEATGVHGVLKIATTNGRLTTVNCGGSLDASSTNGRITADMVAVNGPISLETTNGRISLTVPRNVAGRLEAETSNGSINSAIPVLTRSSARHSIHGTLNGGGPVAIRLRTTNGSIDIEAR